MAERAGAKYGPGAAGDHIRELQERLKAAGQADTPQTGVFDRQTRRSLSAFQKRSGLRGSGDVDGLTLMALAKAAGAEEAPPPPPPVEAMPRITVERVEVPDGPPFPLLQPCELAIESRPSGHTARLTLGPDLVVEGKGESADAARAEVGVAFAKLVKEQWRVPPHARTREQVRVREALAKVLDWAAYKRDRPLADLVYGRVDGPGPTGSLKVYWLVGPGAVRRGETFLAAGEVHAAFAKLMKGDWFKAVIRRRAGALEWVEAPAGAPDPENHEAAQRAWATIPRKSPSERGGWPLPAKTDAPAAKGGKAGKK